MKKAIAPNAYKRFKPLRYQPMKNIGAIINLLGVIIMSSFYFMEHYD
jgi:hypothetical protein